MLHIWCVALLKIVVIPPVEISNFQMWLNGDEKIHIQLSWRFAFLMEPSCFGTARKIIKITFRGYFTGAFKN